MNRLCRQIARSGLTVITLTFALIANADAEAPADHPKWISQVPVLASGDPKSFQFRANFEMLGIRMIAYVSWAPPDHRCVILSDGRDGLPLMLSVGGDAWIYDLIGGQILHCKSEPKFE